MSDYQSNQERTLIDDALVRGIVTKCPPAEASAPEIIMGGDFLLEIKVKNANILRLMRSRGIANPAELARRTGMSPSRLGELINMKCLPVAKNRHQQWTETVRRLADFFGVEPESLFSERQRSAALEKNKFYVEVREAEVAHCLEYLREFNASPEEVAMRKEMQFFFDRAVSKLSTRERTVLDLRLDRTGADISGSMGVSGTRIYQIQAKAKRKLKKMLSGMAADLLP